MAGCPQMTLKQLEFWPDRGSEDLQHRELYDASTGVQQATSMLMHNEGAYISLKRVSVIHEGAVHSRPALTSRSEAKRFFADYWRDNPSSDQERFVVACLDTKYYVQCVVVVTVGTLDASLVHPREVCKPAIIEGSSGVIVSHNHPSGDTSPSKEDHTVTKRLVEAGELLGITVLDHIIHGDATGRVVSIYDG
ncbi:JAB domain-containing protein [bacterium]|nr:JAB domain-containing protein [bacterium]